jgi:hypothetical protein
LFIPAGLGEATHYTYPLRGPARFVLPMQGSIASHGLRFFGSRKTRLALAVKSLFAKRPGAARLREVSRLEGIKSRVCGGQGYTVAALGAPGPYSKDSILFLDAMQQELAIAKVGGTPAAIRLLGNEVAWLGRLGNDESVHVHIPRLIAYEPIADGQLLLQTVGAGRKGVLSLGLSHMQFLGRLQTTGEVHRGYSGSGMEKAMQSRYTALRGLMHGGWEARTEVVLTALRNAGQLSSLGMVPAHRDFSPWNIRLRPEGAFVFDWEYASDGYFPLYDVFHFLMIPRLLRGGVSAADCSGAIRQAVQAARAFQDGEARSTRADLQLLAYFLDLALFYLESNQGKEQGDRVVQRCGQAIDRFAEWRSE